MFKKLLLLLVGLFIFTKTIDASSVMGAEVYYKYLGGLKYEITFRVFRDCRGTALDTSLKAEMLGLKGKDSVTKKLSLKLVSITDITNVCRKVSKPCNPANTQVTSSIKGIEEHIYKDTVDFNVGDTAFKKCCIIRFGIGQCCRPTGTLFGGGKDFWVWSELDICAAKNNSSPIFSTIPNNILCCNLESYSSLAGIDTVDFDSISYSYTNPMEDWTKSISYPSGNLWISAYFPAGWDKSKSSPNTNPPIGIYLDQWDGTIALTPTNCNENTYVSFKIIEWRKDSTAKYVKIGEVRRDIQYIVMTCPDNLAPRITGAFKYETCEGQEICFHVNTSDNPYIPTPPQKPNPPDSVTLTWNKGIGRGATFNIVDTKVRLQSGKFCWTPQESDVSDKPYTFTITAKDNSCPINAIAIKTYSVKVKRVNKATINTTQFSNNKVALESKLVKPYPTQPSYYWQVTDSANNPLSFDYYFFKNSRTSTSNKALDTVIFRKKGKYIIRHQLNNQPLNCPSNYFDTLIIGDLMDVTIAKNYDTTVCLGTPLKFKAKVTNGLAPFTYEWGGAKPDTVSQITVASFIDTTIMLKVTDSKGNMAYTWYNIKMPSTIIVTAGNDQWMCKNDSVTLQPSAWNVGDSCYWEWYWGGNKISEKAIIKVGNSGEYVIKVTDSKKCASKNDTVKVTSIEAQVSAGLDQEICYGQSVSLKANEMIPNVSQTYEWYQLRNLKTDSLLNKNQIVIFKPKNTSNFLVKYAATLVGKSCTSFDTVSVKVNLLTLDFKMGQVCQSQNEFDLHSIITNPSSTYQGIFNWSLDKSLAKPNGSLNTLNDLLVDKDSSVNVRYYLRVDESNINLMGKDKDTLKLSSVFTDVNGCVRNSSSQAIILVKIFDIQLKMNQAEISKCYRDSISSISNTYGVNYKGGQWFTNNDTTGFLKWPQGNHVLLNENFKTNGLDPNGGRYLMKYIYNSNGCESFIDARLKINKLPNLEWYTEIIGDSIIITDNSTDYFGREWYINSQSFSWGISIKLSIADAKSKEIKLKHIGYSCNRIDIIDPFLSSTQSLFLKDNIKIFPNPAKEKLNIEINKSGYFECKLFSIVGELIYEATIEGMKNEIIPTAFPSGNYFVLIKDKDGNVFRKRVVIE